MAHEGWEGLAECGCLVDDERLHVVGSMSNEGDSVGGKWAHALKVLGASPRVLDWICGMGNC